MLILQLQGQMKGPLEDYQVEQIRRWIAQKLPPSVSPNELVRNITSEPDMDHMLTRLNAVEDGLQKLKEALRKNPNAGGIWNSLAFDMTANRFVNDPQKFIQDLGYNPAAP